jgi:hypothetical protein
MAHAGHSATLHIQLECGSDPIRGTIGAAQGPRVAFTGWMELAAALEAARAACDPEPGPAAGE